MYKCIKSKFTFFFFSFFSKSPLISQLVVYCKISHVYNCNWFVTNMPVYIKSVYQWYAYFF